MNTPIPINYRREWHREVILGIGVVAVLVLALDVIAWAVFL